jgi:tetratricopeptide (TPR) repeat protein
VRSRAAALALGLVVGLVLAAARGADYRQDYLDGLAALQRGELDRAVALLTAAAAARPVEQARARLVGAIPEPYLPHHYLGLAYQRLGRCPEALRELHLSAEQGAAKGFPPRQAEALAAITACGGDEPPPAQRPAAEPPPPPAAASLRPPAPAPSSAIVPGDHDSSAPQPTPTLEQALQALLDGDYAAAAAQPDAAPSATGRWRAWHYTVRAAARLALHRLGGERDVALLAEAIADIREAHRADPGFTPPAEAFSPAFLALFAAHR